MLASKETSRKLGVHCFVHMEKRRTLRQQYNIAGDGCEDCCVTCWCSECAICQEAREIKARGIDPKSIIKQQPLLCVVPHTPADAIYDHSHTIVQCQPANVYPQRMNGQEQAYFMPPYSHSLTPPSTPPPAYQYPVLTPEALDGTEKKQ
ncbi:unnamed protein product [Didymodactylos carnosus]|uniref:Uncharacterized protein n=1 Tax=Didymodactylos carnosus TaxID=1234261 RepID=A0A814S783_9BILA|nr:unnamed protein product [Didymodactylos carnosus]CAF1142280.1 unnamed protein product [Didymodactylos carnosus]CAF3863508.1 unnamed protein product [Didymodactylos carnosus]CAF3905995.1 unnamed protein product [Didymodactylos carnosus]